MPQSGKAPETADAIAALAENASPQVHLDRARFRAWLEARRGEATGPLRGEDLWLACACASGDPGALRVLEARYFGALRESLGRAGVPSHQREDVLQRVVRALFVGERPGIEGYRGEGDLGAYLRVVAVRMGRRETGRNAREVALEDSDRAALGDPELDYIKEKYRTEFKEAFAAALAELSPRDRNLLKLSVVDELSIDKLAAIYHLHRSTAARKLSRIREELAEATRRRLEQSLGLEQHELESIAGLVRSQLDLSLTRLLSSKPPRG